MILFASFSITGECTGDQFKCHNGSDIGYCIDAAEYTCDRKADCYDGEDEFDCGKSLYLCGISRYFAVFCGRLR